MAKWRILVVEDEDVIRFFYQEFLTSQGFLVDAAADGLLGLEKLQEHGDETPYDLVITDISMPRMNGIELAREINRNYTRTAVLVLTAVADKDIVVELLRAGVCEFLDKPVETKLLLQKINELLSGQGRPGVVGKLRKLENEIDGLIEQRVEEQRKLLVEWIRGGVQHRFNQPLTVLMANLSMLEQFVKRCGTPDCHKELVESCLADARKAVDVVSGLLRLMTRMQSVEIQQYVGKDAILDFEQSCLNIENVESAEKGEKSSEKPLPIVCESCRQE